MCKRTLPSLVTCFTLSTVVHPLAPEYLLNLKDLSVCFNEITENLNRNGKIEIFQI